MRRGDFENHIRAIHGHGQGEIPNVRKFLLRAPDPNKQVGEASDEHNVTCMSFNAASPATSRPIAGNPFIRQGRLMDFDMMINDVEVTTVPDTGADVNAMTLDTLFQLQRSVVARKEEIGNIKLGNDTSVNALFRVSLRCCLPSIYGEPQEPFRADFHIFLKLASGVRAIVGYKFLEITQMLTSQAWRLKPRFNPGRHIPRCMSIGPVPSAGLRLKIFLDKNLFLALPDTGSEINLMSKACAVKNGLTIVRTVQEETREVEFADGQFEEIVEKVVVTVQAADCSEQTDLAVSDSKLSAAGEASGIQRSSSLLANQPSYKTKVSIAEEPILQTFYVIDKIAHDVILSQSLLHAMDAWNLHQSAFVYTDVQGFEKSMCTIFVRDSKGNNHPRETITQFKQREAFRQSEVAKKQKRLNRDIKRRAGDTERQTTLRQKLAELNQKDQAARVKFDEAVRAFTSP
ncbi:hypothetical protein, variant [Exophiala sideris]|uniref:Uncharacterized protein n=1 Tax=Exophiala sideris TaxID=1016849 RepID=A0A0D1XCK5_9EURO|nr:hypothetical protein PV11_01260 [Exophiala sideris]KIV85582.1 hypothetical protein, variant [Exophiala sideris]